MTDNIEYSKHPSYKLGVGPSGANRHLRTQSTADEDVVTTGSYADGVQIIDETGLVDADAVTDAGATWALPESPAAEGVNDDKAALAESLAEHLVIEKALSFGYTDRLGFDALDADIEPAQLDTIRRISNAATHHPVYDVFGDLTDGQLSDTVGTAQALADAIVGQTLDKLEAVNAVHREPGTWAHKPEFYETADKLGTEWAAKPFVDADWNTTHDELHDTTSIHLPVSNSLWAGSSDVFAGFNPADHGAPADDAAQTEWWEGLASQHPRFGEFGEYSLSDDSNDLDIVNEIAYAINTDIVKKLGGTIN